MSDQLAFDLQTRPALGREDFFVSPANAVAVATLAAPQAWPNGKMALIGPQGAGKTHLAYVFAAETGATSVQANTLAQADIQTLANTPVIVEDVAEIANDTEAQNALFHLHNLVLANGHALLVTGRTAPSRWGLTLPDLASRMVGTAVTTLDPPDDALLSAVLLKLFADRQSPVDPTVIPYLASRMERDLAIAGAIVAELDRAALARKKGVTRPLAAEILDHYFEGVEIMSS
ncbi:MAG: DnaA/Hda family protein [Pseudoruegeria sp.]